MPGQPSKHNKPRPARKSTSLPLSSLQTVLSPNEKNIGKRKRTEPRAQPHYPGQLPHATIIPPCAPRDAIAKLTLPSAPFRDCRNHRPGDALASNRCRTHTCAAFHTPPPSPHAAKTHSPPTHSLLPPKPFRRSLYGTPRTTSLVPLPSSRRRTLTAPVLPSPTQTAPPRRVTSPSQD